MRHGLAALVDVKDKIADNNFVTFNQLILAQLQISIHFLGGLRAGY